jgi:hypothetical protein
LFSVAIILFIAKFVLKLNSKYVGFSIHKIAVVVV